ncbi:MAG: trehalase family glycosidase [Bacteroidota bacterium]
MKPILVLLILLAAGLFSCSSEATMPDLDPVELAAATNQEALVRGWNTWNNPSLLAQVHMPTGLTLQWLLRKKRGGPYWLRDAYVAKPQYNFAEKIRPLEHAYDGSYTRLKLSWEGCTATIESATQGEEVFMRFRPDSIPEKVHSLILETGYLWNKPGQLSKSGQLILAESSQQRHKIRYLGQAVNVPLPLTAPYFSFESDQEIIVYTGPERTAAEIETIFTENLATHQQKAEAFGEQAEVYQAAQSVVAWNLIYDAFNDRPISSVSRIWNEAWAGYIIFDWDTYFIALLAGIDNKELAYANVLAITNSITENGFIPNVAATNHLSNDRSQPPVGALAIKLLYDRYGDRWLLEATFDQLLRWNRWWDQSRNNQGYLSWGSDPHPEGMEPHSLEAAKWESGLDNSPLFDEASFDATTHMLDLASVGLLSLYIADCKYLAVIAEELGQYEAIEELTERAAAYTLQLQTLWDEASGIFRDKNLSTGAFTDHLAPTHFYPLLAAAATPEQASRMVEEHLLNPTEFFGEYMIPSIARNDPGFSDNSYWRGRIWAPMNFLVYLGLHNYELPQARRLIAEKSAQLLLESWREERHVYENYNATTGRGDDVLNSDPFYAWGGLLGLIALMENGHFPLKEMEE